MKSDTHKSSSKKEQAAKQINDLAADMIRMIAEGPKEWEQSWQNVECGIPSNYLTKHRYTGSNLTLLTLHSWFNGWDDKRFVTEKQLEQIPNAEGKTAELFPDQKPAVILRPFLKTSRIPVNDDEDISDIEPEKLEQDENGKLFKLVDRVYFTNVKVYNVAQTTAKVEPEKALPPRAWEDCEFFERLVEASGIRLAQGGNNACYRPAEDIIMMPPKEAFTSGGAYYSALMHEFFHATGAEHRFAREKGKRFGDEKYAFEELRAELFGIACASMFGLPVNRENSAAYLASWSKAVADGKGKAIIKAASDVEKVLVTVMEIANGEQPSQAAWFPQVDFSVMPTPFKDMEMYLAEQEEKAFQESRALCREVESPDALARRVFPDLSGIANASVCQQIGEALFEMPPLASTDRDNDEAIAHLKMTGAAGEVYYLTEFDLAAGRAYGWVMEDGDVFSGRCRYIEQDELKEVHKVDLRFEPAPVGDVIGRLEQRAYAHQSCHLDDGPECSIDAYGSLSCNDFDEDNYRLSYGY